MNWPNIQLTSPFHFYHSNISQCTFLELYLSEINIENCKAHEVDFRGTTLSKSNLNNTDFQGALFGKTNFQKANLSGAINYAIDPYHNELKEATFSYPNVINLLKMMKIEIVGLP